MIKLRARGNLTMSNKTGYSFHHLYDITEKGTGRCNFGKAVESPEFVKKIDELASKIDVMANYILNPNSRDR